MMRPSAQQGDNRTGIVAAGPLAEEMVQATQEFPPSSPGDAQAIAEVRIAYAQEGDGLGETPSTLKNKAKAAVASPVGSQPTLLMDKLGERLAFEHAGARLYEALLSKYRAYGSFEGGPSGDDLLHILTEEYEHAELLAQTMKDMGGDPTALTPAANLAANISAGLPQVLSDPRTNLLQSLEAIIVAELADNECWTALAQLAEQDGHDQLTAKCVQALAHEREHLRNVRAWIAAGQGRIARAGEGAEMPDVAEGADFTFSADSPVDREGYAVSEEERTEQGEAGKSRPGSVRSEKGNSKRRRR
jgi:ferritin-like protein